MTNRGSRGRAATAAAIRSRFVVPVLALIVWIGVYPAAFTGKTETTIEALIAQVQSKSGANR